MTRAWLAGLALVSLARVAQAGCGDATGDRPVYLSFDVARAVELSRLDELLSRHQAKATFFVSDDAISGDVGDAADDRSAWWTARAAEGHAFGVLDKAASPARVCAGAQATAARFHEMTGRFMPKLFRVSGASATPPLVAAAAGCDWVNVAGSVALPMEAAGRKGTNAQSLRRALHDVRPGDVLRVRLGASRRADAWARADLEPLVEGLQARGLCFATLREHPQYRSQFSW
jgi:peptidoglycan/xylan/chitin deacetylase (PgdA/CDA1 family)